MYFLTPTTLIGWIPFCLILFAVIPRRQAVVIGIIGAWLFLPPTTISIAGLPDYGKGSAFSIGILLGTLMFMPDRVLQFRPHWLDLAMLCFCVCPFASSLANGLGVYDGFSGIIGHILTWGLAYLVGRIHFSDERGLRDLMVAIVVGGLIYVPFCIWEMRMSPMLLPRLYGVSPHNVESRLGGWRPRVFLTSGLELGMWMSVTLLTATWLWKSSSLKQLAGYPFGTYFLPVLAVTTVLCRASGAVALLFLGLAVLALSVRFNRRLPMLLMLSVPFLYVGIRVPNLWDYSGAVSFLERNFDHDRAQSLEFRFQNEDVLIAKAVQMPAFGWGGWGRSRVFNDNGDDVTVTDGLWIILLGPFGVVGLGSFLAAFLLPGIVFVWRYQARRWAEPAVAAQAAAVAVIGIYMIDCLLNAFVNSVYMAVLGGLVSCLQRGVDLSAGDVDPGRFDYDDVRPPADGVAARGAGFALADRYIEMARDYRRMGSDEKASSAWRLAYDLLVRRCALEPDDLGLSRLRFDCANDLAWFLLSRPGPEPGDRAEAVSLARQATQADPDNPIYWNTLAAALCRVGDDHAAIDAAERVLALESAVPSGFDFAVLALAHARLGGIDEAARWLAEARAWREQSRVGSAVLDELIDEAQSVLA